MPRSSHNYLHTYDTTIAELASSPDSLALMHRAVLCLARVGALDFAWGEYGRYGLGAVSADNFPKNGAKSGDAKLLEDIMSLKGRLLKDLALRAAKNEGADGSDAHTAFARRSVTAYARAFSATSGYYSGVNVAALSLLGGRSGRTVADKASAVLDLLPNEKAQNKEDTYYIEATRAECLLLMGHKNKAGEILQDALMHDPLNYTAHATTFKQFGMIMDARGESTEWLEPFAPPTAAHFAGHIFSDDPTASNYLEAQMQENLRAAVSDQIQRHDIGFGYGALAAGSDILIAETLLQEGAELHVVLPAPVDQFIAASVTPYGSSWDTRFDQCLAEASTVRICGNIDSAWPDKSSAQYASQSAMGRAVIRAGTRFGHAAQLLILDGEDTNSATRADALSWRQTGRNQIIIPFEGKRTRGQSLPTNQSQTLMAILHMDLRALQVDQGAQDSILDSTLASALDIAKACARSPKPLLFKPTDTGVLIGFERAGNAARCARDILKRLKNQFPDNAVHISGHYAAVTDPQNLCGDLLQSLQNMSAASIAGEIYISEPFAAILAVFHAADFTVEYAGTRQVEPVSPEIRLFHLS